MNIIKKAKRWMAVILVALMLSTWLAVWRVSDAYAADSVSAKVTSHTVKIGDTVTVTVTLNSNSEMGAQSIFVSYDQQVLELAAEGDVSGGGGRAQWIGTDTKKSVSFTLKFKTLKVGKSTISIDTQASMISDMNEERMNINASSGSVTVNAPVSYSGDNTLKSLSVSPGALTPAFASSVYDYTVSIGENDSKLTVSAVANHSKAKVSVTGNTDLKPGSNTVSIMVTAENGNKRNYTITVNKPVPETTAPEPTVNKTAVVNGITYDIIEDYSLRPLPDSFAPTECQYNGQTVMAGKHAGSGLTIMYLQATDDKGKSGFYVYDTVNKTFSPYIVLGESEIRYVVLPIFDNMEKPDGYKMVDMTVNDMQVKVLKNSNDDFYLFYGMSSAGNAGWYSYDTKENTVQRYVAAISADNNGETDGSKESSSDKLISGAGIWKILAVIMTVIAIAMAGITVNVMSKNKKLLASGTKVSDRFDDDKDADNDIIGNKSDKNANLNKPESDDEDDEDDEDGNENVFIDEDILLDEDVLEVSEVRENAQTVDVSEKSEILELSEITDIDMQETSENPQIPDGDEEVSLEEIDDSEIEVIEFDDTDKN